MNKHQKRNPKPEKRFQHSNPKFLTESIQLTNNIIYHNQQYKLKGIDYILKTNLN